DPVLGLAAAGLDEQWPKEQREPLDAHPDRLGGDEMTELMQDDQRGEAEECQQVRHLTMSLPGRVNVSARGRASVYAAARAATSSAARLRARLSASPSASNE